VADAGDRESLLGVRERSKKIDSDNREEIKSAGIKSFPDNLERNGFDLLIGCPFEDSHILKTESTPVLKLELTSPKLSQVFKLSGGLKDMHSIARVPKSGLLKTTCGLTRMEMHAQCSPKPLWTAS
jgi:hypothetical protein